MANFIFSTRANTVADFKPIQLNFPHFPFQKKKTKKNWYMKRIDFKRVNRTNKSIILYKVKQKYAKYTKILRSQLILILILLKNP